MLEATCKIKQIISGGQTGADQASLDAAITLGIPTGGTAPKGWIIQTYEGNDVPLPELETKYGLVECDESGYPPRTIKNVADSDAVLWVGFADSRGGRLTIKTARRLGKPLIINPTPEELRLWVNEHNVQILDVAGNRFSKYNPEISIQTYRLIIDAFKGDFPINPIADELAFWKFRTEALIPVLQASCNLTQNNQYELRGRTSFQTIVPTREYEELKAVTANYLRLAKQESES